MNPMVTGGNIPTRTPPERGSFPLDHFRECRPIHDAYLKCLKSHKHDNLACKENAKIYLQCRMDKNLMARDTLENLGFSENDKVTEERKTIVAEKDAVHRKGRDQQSDGFVVVKPSLSGPDAWIRPSILGGGSWSVGRRLWSSRSTE